MVQSKEFLTGSNFYLQIDGVVDNLPIKSFSTAQVAAEVPQQIMGVASKGKAVVQATPTTVNTNPIDLTVTTMIMDSDSQFFKWLMKCLGLEGGSRQVMTERKGGSIFALKQEGGVAFQCDFANAFPKAYQPPQFDAASSDMATEQFILVCESFKRVK